MHEQHMELNGLCQVGLVVNATLSLIYSNLLGLEYVLLWQKGPPVSMVVLLFATY